MIFPIRRIAIRLFLTWIVCFTGSANAALILDVGPGGDAIPCGPACGNSFGATFGWLFEVTQTISVDGIGVWDAGANGIGPSGVSAGLWEDGGNLLASAIVSSASSPIASVGAGQWLFEDFPAIILPPGRYVIGSVFFEDTPLPQFFTAFATVPEITYLDGRLSVFPNSGFQRPDTFFGLEDGIFGPSLRTSPIEVSLPSTLVLFILSLAVFLLRRKPANSL